MSEIVYQPLRVSFLDMAGIQIALDAMRLPKKQTAATSHDSDLRLAAKLIMAGHDHAKMMRGAVVWYRLECQVGWLIEYVTYRAGIECLSSSSTMHNELLQLKGNELVEQKQKGLPKKVYTRIEVASFQALRRMYIARRGHRHPDWQVFCDWIEHIPYFSKLIFPEGEQK